MPIEIRELVIKATVQQDGSAATAGTASGNNNVGSKEDIIKDCIDKLSEVIKQRNER